MLNIYFGRWDLNDEMFINNMEDYFDVSYTDEWIEDETSRKIIKDIDRSEVIGNGAIDSPFLGIISPEKLSGGTKMLITMNIEGSKNIYEGTKCGDNCSDWILELSKNRDIIMTRRYLIQFTEDDFKIRILNDNSIVNNNKELFDKYFEFRDNTY